MMKKWCSVHGNTTLIQRTDARRAERRARYATDTSRKEVRMVVPDQTEERTIT